MFLYETTDEVLAHKSKLGCATLKEPKRLELELQHHLSIDVSIRQGQSARALADRDAAAYDAEEVRSQNVALELAVRAAEGKALTEAHQKDALKRQLVTLKQETGGRQAGAGAQGARRGARARAGAQAEGGTGGCRGGGGKEQGDGGVWAKWRALCSNVTTTRVVEVHQQLGSHCVFGVTVIQSFSKFWIFYSNN